MIGTIEANWQLALGLLLLAIGLAWFIWGRGNKVRDRAVTRDVLDEGAAPAQRNTALIDTPPAAAVIVPPPMSVGMAGIGEIVAHAAEEEVEAAPAPVAATAPTPGDDLSKIKGLGPKMQALLPTLGLTTYAQIAALTDADLDALDARLGAFAGRPRRDNWVEQAKLLQGGDTAAYEAKFGKL
jgi:predicted flap endonuclease-1-like 5' DNA nuclease